VLRKLRQLIDDSYAGSELQNTGGQPADDRTREAKDHAA
jgi:hypothetical protein